jgi:uncharacterized protein YndB with AHSA1/START domain
MTPERRIEVEIEVPATPEQAWEAVATGPGITAWFMPADVEGHVGGSIVHHHETDMETSGTVIAYDPPHRFAYEELGWMPDGERAAHVTATEFLVEARSGGSCVVRVVMSGFADEGDAWDRAIESFQAGWRQALLGLRLYLSHFRGEPVATINAVGEEDAPADAVWADLTGALGLPAQPQEGERIATSAPGVPRLAGTVEKAGERMLTLVLDEPAPGIGLVAAGGPGEQVYVFVRAQLFGDDAAEVAAREQEAWTAWLAGRALPTAGAQQ